MSKRTPTEHAEIFVKGLNAKFATDTLRYEVDGLNKFDRIVMVNYGSRSSHAFVEKATGAVYKSAGWKVPAKGVRYETVFEAIEAADRFGGYLYLR